MSKHTLILFNDDSLENAQKKWEAIVGEDAFDLEFSPLFDWARNHIHETPGDSQAFNLSNKDTLCTDAIVEVVTSRKGQMTKLLKIVPSPQFWDINNSRGEIIQVYSEVFFNVITKRGTDLSRKVKLYGRDDEMMSILRSLHSVWAIPNSSAEFEGRFLTIALN